MKKSFQLYLQYIKGIIKMRFNKTWVLVIAVVIVAALIRLLPHPFNFTPIGALALFSGSILYKRKWALVLPLGGLILSDLVMEYFNPGSGIYDGILAVYASFVLIALLGSRLKSNKSIVRVFGFSLTSSVLFFLITNFTFWYAGQLYPVSINGLLESYYMGLPFFRNGLLGDLFFNGLFFGSYYFLTIRIKSLQKALNL
jgi:hypothetical protein